MNCVDKLHKRAVLNIPDKVSRYMTKSVHPFFITDKKQQLFEIKLFDLLHLLKSSVEFNDL